MVNGVKVARHYEPDDRLIPLMMAATGASGRAGDRPAVQPLPPPVTWEKLEHWIRVFSADKAWEGIEKCLITARRLGGHDEQIIPLLYECALEPFFLGHTTNLPLLGFLAELLEEFGWDRGGRAGLQPGREDTRPGSRRAGRTPPGGDQDVRTHQCTDR